MDRLFPIVELPPAPRFGSKKVALVYTYGAGELSSFKPYLDYNEEIFKNFYFFDVQDTITFFSENDPRASSNNAESLEKAKDLEKELVD